MKEKFPLDKAICIGAIAGVVIAIVVLVLVIGARGRQIEELEEQIASIQRQAQVEIDQAWADAETAKKEAEIEIKNLPADAVAIRFLSDADILERGEFVDGLAREIVKHQLKFFREMGVELVAVD